MQVTDIGFIFKLQHFQENTYIAKVLGKTTGIYSGIINTRTKGVKNICFAGNLVEFTWKARLREHLGSFTFELITPYTPLFLNKALELLSIESIFNLLEIMFHEGETMEGIFEYLKYYLEKLKSSGFCFRTYINFELFLLKEAGYSLDISKCTVSGDTENLVFVSPKSARAVSYKSGLPYKDKLLHLPAFFSNPDLSINREDKTAAFKLTSYFITKHFSQGNKELNLRARENFIKFMINS